MQLLAQLLFYQCMLSSFWYSMLISIHSLILNIPSALSIQQSHTQQPLSSSRTFWSFCICIEGSPWSPALRIKMLPTKRSHGLSLIHSPCSPWLSRRFLKRIIFTAVLQTPKRAKGPFTYSPMKMWWSVVVCNAFHFLKFLRWVKNIHWNLTQKLIWESVDSSIFWDKIYYKAPRGRTDL